MQALQPEILLNKVGKFIPYIFIEWVHLPNNEANCPMYNTWVENFVRGGYISLDPGGNNMILKPTLEGLHYISGTMVEIQRENFYIDVLWVHKSVTNLF